MTDRHSCFPSRQPECASPHVLEYTHRPQNLDEISWLSGVQILADLATIFPNNLFPVWHHDLPGPVNFDHQIEVSKSIIRGNRGVPSFNLLSPPVCIRLVIPSA